MIVEIQGKPAEIRARDRGSDRKIDLRGQSLGGGQLPPGVRRSANVYRGGAVDRTVGSRDRQARQARTGGTHMVRRIVLPLIGIRPALNPILNRSTARNAVTLTVVSVRRASRACEPSRRSLSAARSARSTPGSPCPPVPDSLSGVPASAAPPVVPGRVQLPDGVPPAVGARPARSAGAGWLCSSCERAMAFSIAYGSLGR